MNSSRQLKRRLKGAGAVLVTALFLRSPGTPAWAGVDPGERYQEEREKAMEAQVLQVGAPPEEEVKPEEIKRLKKELLRFPKKKRLRLGGDFDMTYDTNPSTLPIHHEKEDTTFNLNPFAEIDLSGRRTDLRFEFRESHLYNVKRSRTPGNDTMGQEGRIRFGRKIMKKTTLSLNDRLNRSSSRVQGIDDGKKVSWVNSHRSALSYEFNPKLVLNFETNFSNTYFPHENFDETSTYSLDFDPNLLFRPTQKTQLTFGYRRGLSHIHNESTDVATHVFRTGYSGKITAKSSVSADFAWTLQDPNSAQAAQSKEYATNLGYIWQATRKTSIRLSYSNSYLHSLSDSISSGALLKSSTRTISDTLSLSARLRLNRKINTEFSFNGSHSHSRTKQTGSANAKTQTWTLPFQLALDYDLARWIRLRLSYTFRFRLGDEPKTDETRQHTWLVSTNAAF